MKENQTARILVLIVLFFVALIGGVMLFIGNRDAQVNAALQEQIHYLDISYKQSLDRFQVIADNVNDSLKKEKVLLSVFGKALDASEEERSILRDKLYDYLKDEYKRLQFLGVKQFAFFLPDNRSFLRMHKPEQFGDDLSSLRYSVNYTNQTERPISGFEEGRTSHAFRHLFPLFYEGEYIGCYDISFSSTMIQNYTMRASNIHTHFIVNQHIFKSQEWKSAINEEYYPSIEHQAYYFSMSDHVNHTRLENSKKNIIEPFRDMINSKMEQGMAFAIYKEISENIRVVAFLPIKIIEGDRVVAYLVSYTDAPAIGKLLQSNKINIAVLAFILVIVFVIIYRSLLYRDRLKYELQHDVLTEISNRKYFLQLAQVEYDKASRLGHEFCIVMVDLDFFKNVNDTYGHQCGDMVLKESAQLMSKNIRIYDIIGRYGGEEFILLMMTNKHNARGTLESIREKIDEHGFVCNNATIHLTISSGIAQYQNDESLQSLIKRADDALYKAKEGGRNRIESA